MFNRYPLASYRLRYQVVRSWWESSYTSRCRHSVLDAWTYLDYGLDSYELKLNSMIVIENRSMCDLYEWWNVSIGILYDII